MRFAEPHWHFWYVSMILIVNLNTHTMPYIPWNSTEIITAILEIFPKVERCVGCCVGPTFCALLMTTGHISAMCGATSIDFVAVLLALFHIRTRLSPTNFFDICTQVHVVPREKGEGDGRKLSMSTPLKSHCSRLQYFLNDCSVSLVPNTKTFAHLISDLVNEKQSKCQGHFRSLEGLINRCGFRLCGFGIFGWTAQVEDSLKLAILLWV